MTQDEKDVAAMLSDISETGTTGRGSPRQFEALISRGFIEEEEHRSLTAKFAREGT